MDFALLFKGLYKPLLHVIKQLGLFFLSLEEWWISKTAYTKLNLRWVLFTVLLFTAAVLREIKTKEDELVNYNRSVHNSVLLQKKVDFLEYRYMSKLEEDIKELKNIRSIAEQNNAQLKTIAK